MNNFISTYSLQPLAFLKNQREARIIPFINNLKFSDVSSDDIFNRNLSSIKKSVLLIPVEISPGKYVRHTYEKRNITYAQQLAGAFPEFYHHEISFPLKGSLELFQYIADNVESYSNEHGLILPRGNNLVVYASLPTLENENAVSHALDTLSLTRRLIDYNNASIIEWNANVEMRINQLMEAQRKLLIEKFGH